MNKPNAWDYLRRGDPEQGIELAREAYGHSKSPSHIMELGIAHLWTSDYKSAERHFQDAIRTHPFTVSSFYEMAGAAAWCADDPSKAVRYWQDGLKSQFADAGVAISLPLLLFVASILRPSVFPRKEAEQILKKQLENPRAESWPGALAEFVLGQIDQGSLEQSCIGKRERTTLHRRWQAQFFEDVFEFARGNLGREVFRELLRRAADTSQPEWAEEGNFLTLLWSAEFFIARHEAGKPG